MPKRWRIANNENVGVRFPRYDFFGDIVGSPQVAESATVLAIKQKAVHDPKPEEFLKGREKACYLYRVEQTVLFCIGKIKGGR